MYMCVYYIYIHYWCLVHLRWAEVWSAIGAGAMSAVYDLARSSSGTQVRTAAEQLQSFDFSRSCWLCVCGFSSICACRIMWCTCQPGVCVYVYIYIFVCRCVGVCRCVPILGHRQRVPRLPMPGPRSAPVASKPEVRDEAPVAIFVGMLSENHETHIGSKGMVFLF